MRRIIVALAILLPVILVIGILFWYFAFYQKPASEAPGTTKPSPGPGFGNLSPYASLCKEFQKTKAKNSCEKAIELALADSPGKIQEISIGPVKSSVPTSSGLRERRMIDMWLINIMLTKPYFDDKFNKQITVLQIGIPLNEDNLIYKKPLQ